MGLMCETAVSSLLAAVLFVATARAANTPAPLVLQPSQFWDGNDGPWSTFSFTVGTPAQSIRLLPATGQSAVWPILPEGCLNDDRSFTTCSDARGKVFMQNQSTSWVEEGIYSLSTLWVERQLGVGSDARGHYGYDTVGLGWPSQGLPTLDGQVVGGIADKSIYEGVFPLSPRPVNFTDLNNPHPTVLHNLVNQSTIPSTSWSYTAGSYNNVPKVLGSLTLGGYDTARFVPNNISIPFGPDISRDLLCAVQSVTANVTGTSENLMTTGNYWFIDSLVASMWFPENVCTAFEDAFGIVWDDEYSIYLINDTQHELLTEKNPAVTFRIGQNTSTSETVDIVMPYSSLALNASWPVYPNATRYFPLKRAVNDTQYTLGRAFLQNAYVIANYDHSNFSVHQALMVDSSSTQNIVPIQDVTVTQQKKSTLSTGAIVGIAVGAAAAGIIVALAVFLTYRRKKQRREAYEAAAAAEAAEAERKAREQAEELDSGGAGAGAVEHKTELDANNQTKHEMEGSEGVKAELYGQEARKYAEMEAQATPVFEMPANEDVMLPELESPDQGNQNAQAAAAAARPRAELEAPHESRIAAMREHEQEQEQEEEERK